MQARVLHRQQVVAGGDAGAAHRHHVTGRMRAEQFAEFLRQLFARLEAAVDEVVGVGAIDRTRHVPCDAVDRFDVAADAGYKLEIFGDYFFVAAADRLMAIRKDGKEFEKILDSAPRGTKMAPNGKRAVYWSNSEIWIFHLEEKTDPPAASAGEKTFIARFSEKITDCDWFNSDYLIFVAGDRVRTAEIDNRDKINFAEIAEFSKIGGENSGAGKMFMDQDKKILYLLAGKTLRQTNLYE